MKNLFLLLSILAFLSNVNAQELLEKSKRTQAEEFYGEAGRLTYMDVIQIGKLKNVEVNVHHYRDMITDESRSVVRLESRYVSSYTSDMKIAALDTDELDGFLKSLKIMQEDVVTTSPTNYVEVKFTSRTGFTAVSFWDIDKKEWRFSLKLEEYDSNSHFFFKKEDILTLMSLVTKAAYEIEKNKKN